MKCTPQKAMARQSVLDAAIWGAELAQGDGPGRIYLVDPLGNLMLSYSAASPDKALLTDVKKLLRLSHIG